MYSLLVVDDGEALIPLLESVLKPAFNLKVCSTSDEALEWIQENPLFDALLTDYNLDGVSGISLADRCRKVNPNLTVIIMSGYAPRANLNPSYSWLQKPFHLPELVEIVTDAIENK